MTTDKINELQRLKSCVVVADQLLAVLNEQAVRLGMNKWQLIGVDLGALVDGAEVDGATVRAVTATNIDPPGEPKMTTFKIGQTYTARSAWDSGALYRATVIARSPRTLTCDLEGVGIKKFRIRTYNGSECFSPVGRYSMSPTMYADQP